jgi:hypothetical protein
MIQKHIPYAFLIIILVFSVLSKIAPIMHEIPTFRVVL